MNTTKRILVFALSAISIVLLIYFLSPLSNQTGNTDIYSIRTFQSGEGWGYQINKKEEMIILQPYMPCITGEKPFPDEKSALAVGKLVLLKIKSNGDPSITMEELNKTIHISDY
ncbi:DUF4907 domain-containing protein [uncultured Proteiniphilum sp.]|uniref:DUF4907 domain-containing protein n=1 Tax=uncultured Proteiniphilum sp. TaxID=497637 RepID=UPI002635934C|nr:DUF4907 domain-containing protein [uncultured Proteiniphilum sp.]